MSAREWGLIGPQIVTGLVVAFVRHDWKHIKLYGIRSSSSWCRGSYTQWGLPYWWELRSLQSFDFTNSFSERRHKIIVSNRCGIIF